LIVKRRSTEDGKWIVENEEEKGMRGKVEEGKSQDMEKARWASRRQSSWT